MKVCVACDEIFEASAWRCPRCDHAPVSRKGFLAFSPDAGGLAEFRAEFFSDLIRLESESFWFRSRNRLIAWVLRKYFPQARDAFEVGCGTGFVLSEIRRAFPALNVSGSDVYVEGLQFASERLPGVPLYQMEATRVPFVEEFDVICSLDVLEHIEKDEVALGQMRRALRPQGGLIVTVPQHACLWSAVDEYSLHKRRYARRELVQKARRAGFDVLRVTSFVALLFPLLVASRIRTRGRVETFDPHVEFRLSRRAGATLGAMMTLERALIGAGLSFPFGGSLLLVGRRRPDAVAPSRNASHARCA